MTKPTIAIYARYSSDLQNPSSIDDQIGLCKTLIDRQFGVKRPVAVFHDAAITGATMARPGLTALLQASDAHEFDLVVAEGLDRISRSLADIAQIYQILKHNGVRVWTAHEGEVGDLHIGFKGTMNALFLKDMSDKVRRAHRALAEAGRATSSVAYGYQAIRGITDERGRYVNGLREINENEAIIIRRIFREIADGIPVASIAKALNDEKIPSPSGGRWRAHSIRGERNRGKGILNNELYRGWLIYNRTRKVVDPRTGKRRYEINPESEWGRTHVPELQIVPDELWDSVQGKRPRPREKKARVSRSTSHIDGPGNTRPLTGLVKCGWCGGQKSLANAGRYICNNYRYYNKRCKNARGQQEEHLTVLVFEDLRDQIDLFDDWKKRVGNYLEKEMSGRLNLIAEADRIEKRIERLIDAIERGVTSNTITVRVVDLQQRLQDIRSLPEIPDPNLSTSAIRERLSTALTIMEEEFWNQKYALPIRNLLALVVAEIVLTPKEHSRRGETVRIKLKPSGWPEFYLAIHAEWPKVGRSTG